MTGATMRDQSTVTGALIALHTAERFSDLPAAIVRVYAKFTDELDLSLHGDGAFSAFEAWREALRIPPAAVHCTVYDEALHLQAQAALCGTSMRLIAYGATPTAGRGTSTESGVAA